MQATVSLTDVRRLIQNRRDDVFLHRTLRHHFPPRPASALLHHRTPAGRYQAGQMDGQAFHNDLIRCLRDGTAPADAPWRLRPALRALEREGFRLVAEVESESYVFDDLGLRLRGIPDLVGWCRDWRKALVEVKTIHQLPARFPYLEHSIQASALFQMCWGHWPHPTRHVIGVLYVESTAPFAARLLPVQTPSRFIRVGADLARHLLSGSN